MIYWNCAANRDIYNVRERERVNDEGTTLERNWRVYLGRTLEVKRGRQHWMVALSMLGAAVFRARACHAALWGRVSVYSWAMCAILKVVALWLIDWLWLILACSKVFAHAWGKLYLLIFSGAFRASSIFSRVIRDSSGKVLCMRAVNIAHLEFVCIKFLYKYNVSLRHYNWVD